MTRISLIEPDKDFCQRLAYYLENQGWDIDQHTDPARCHESAPVIALVADAPPRCDAIGVVRALHRRDPKIGILVLREQYSTARDITLLHEGADMILAKDVSFPEVSAYVSTIFRRLGFGRWRVDLSERRLYSPVGRHTRVNHTEAALLEVLGRHAGHVVGRPQIVKAFGAEWINYDERRLEKVVSRLRQRCRAETGNTLPLRTEHGVGYSFSEQLQIHTLRRHS